MLLTALSLVVVTAIVGRELVAPAIDLRRSQRLRTTTLIRTYASLVREIPHALAFSLFESVRRRTDVRSALAVAAVSVVACILLGRVALGPDRLEALGWFGLLATGALGLGIGLARNVRALVQQDIDCDEQPRS